MDGYLLELKVLGQAVIALLCGGIVGYERESAGKWAGLRTHMLVCLASMLFVKVGDLWMLEPELRRSFVQVDPLRIVEAIVTGIAFIGAGTIFRDASRNTARGLTTAASLLTVAPIGIAVGVERYLLAGGASLLLVFVLRGVGLLERHTIDGEPSEKDE